MDQVDRKIIFERAESYRRRFGLEASAEFVGLRDQLAARCATVENYASRLLDEVRSDADVVGTVEGKEVVKGCGEILAAVKRIQAAAA